MRVWVSMGLDIRIVLGTYLKTRRHGCVTVKAFIYSPPSELFTGKV